MALRKHKVSTTWTPELAYVIGIIASDGNLSANGRTINITSRDEEMVTNIKNILSLSNKITKKARGGSRQKIYSFLQFGDIAFYEFLYSIGLTRAKSRTIGPIQVPLKYFCDFLRGCIDGDGSIGTYRHPDTTRPQLRIRLCSASSDFLPWILMMTRKACNVSGGFIYKTRNKTMYTLTFANNDSRNILKRMYHSSSVPCLKRKRVLAEPFMKGE